MFAATDAGLFVTTDNGVNWAKPTSSSYAAVDGNVTAVVVDPTTPSTIYLGGGRATIARSSDGGVSWVPVTGLAPVGSDSFVALAIAASSAAVVYASVGSIDGPVVVYKTTNGGANWAQLPGVPDFTGQAYSYGFGTAEQGWYDNVLAVDPANPDHVIAGGIAMVETKDGGSSWINTNGQSYFGDGSNRDHPDHHALAFRSDHQVWTSNDGGVYLYNPAADLMSNNNGNLSITQFYAGFNEAGGSLLAGAQDNGSARTDKITGPAAWTGIFLGDGGPSAITPNKTQLQFIEADGRLFRTIDGFASDLSDITPTQSNGPFTPPMIVVPNLAFPASPSVFYGGADLYRTTSPSVSTPAWSQVTTTGTGVTAIAASPSSPQVIYVGFSNGIVEVSTNNGVSFSPLARQPFVDQFITGLAVDPTNPKAVTASVSFNNTRYVLGQPHVAQYTYRTTASSGSWAVITGNLPMNAAVSKVVYDNGALVSATDTGVYATSAAAGSGTSWTRTGTNLPNVQVQDLFLDPTTSDLYAVTHGRGAWRLAAPVIPAPRSFTLAQTAAGAATMTWRPPAVPAGQTITGYRVTRDGVDSSGTGPYSTTVAASVRSFTMNRLVVGRTYKLKVQAITGAGTGLAATGRVTIVVPAPRSFALAQTAAGAATMTWRPPAVPAGQTITGYRVTRDGVDSSGTGPYSTTVAASVRSFTMNRLVVGRTYKLKVQAITGAGTGLAATGKVTIK